MSRRLPTLTFGPADTIGRTRLATLKLVLKSCEKAWYTLTKSPGECFTCHSIALGMLTYCLGSARIWPLPAAEQVHDPIDEIINEVCESTTPNPGYKLCPSCKAKIAGLQTPVQQLKGTLQAIRESMGANFPPL
jgi:hypothetical protein